MTDTDQDETSSSDPDGADAPRYKGQLTLTWTNKDLALLAREDGGYEWVEPKDHRVAEIRLLRDAGAVGDALAETDRANGNLLIRGDALNALRSLKSLPEFEEQVVGKVKLAYIDPPFNTQQTFEHYDDALEHSVWLTMMRDRLVQIRDLLAPDGSIWVHLDDDEMAYCRAVLDEVFERRNFIATVVWQKRTSRENRAAFGSAHDYIMVYSPAGPKGWRDVRNRLSRSGGKATNPDNDPNGPWDSIPFTAQGFRKNQMYKITTPTGVVHDPPKGRCWSATEPEYKRLLGEGRIYFPKKGNGRPRVKQYADEAKGLVPMTWWPAADVGDNEAAKKEILALFEDVDPFGTPKPEALLRRIIEIGSNEDDLVLDCFAGSGTTAAVAHKLARRWITVERERKTIDTFTAPRLQRVVDGTDPGGVTELVGWEGGGGFRVLDIAPSMYTDEDGVVLLADWATNAALAEATAAQLGYDYEPDPPFAGRQGKRRLAIVDGHVSEKVAELLLAALNDGEKLDVCGVGLDPLVTKVLEQQRPGSRARKIPQDIVLTYANPSAWRVSVARGAAELETPDAPAAAAGGAVTGAGAQ